MPYRVDIAAAPRDAADLLIALGAFDVEATADGIAAIMPDGVTADAIAAALGVHDIGVSAVVGRDDDSVWMLTPRTARVGRLVIAPESLPAPPGALRLSGAAAFGSGFHPTTILCLEALETAIELLRPRSVVDVGTGSGVLALAALLHGVPRAVGVDIDPLALDAAAQNARLNSLTGRLELVSGDIGSVNGAWPLVVANVLPAPLMEMAPLLVRRLSHSGRVVLSGIPTSLAADVDQVYRRLGLRPVGHQTRDGWSGLVLDASW